jgi:hypothetical protein
VHETCCITFDMPLRCLALTMLAACASSPVTSAPAVRLAADPVEDLCPMTVPGTVVRSEAIDGGTALVFTTPGDFAELRRRVRTLVRMHTLRVGERDTLVATTDDLATGARLNIRPLDAAKSTTIHDYTSRRAVELASGYCPRVASDTLVTWLTTDQPRDRITSR